MSGISTFSKAVICGSRLKFWKTKPTRSFRIRASSFRSSPATSFPRSR